MQLKLIAFTVLYFLTFNFFLQAQCVKPAFSNNEQLNYEIVYNWHKIWIAAGEVNFNIKNTYINNVQLFDCVITGKSLPSWDWLYNVNDYFHATLDTCLIRSTFYEQRTKEGSFKTNVKYIYNNTENKLYAYASTSKKPYFADTLSNIADIYDIANAVYNFRSRNLQALNEGEKIYIRLMIDGKAHPIFLRYIGKEILTAHDKKKYRALKFSALLVEGTMFKAGEDITLWISDDQNKIAIMVEAKILIGSVKAVLKNYKNLKYKFSALVE